MENKTNLFMETMGLMTESFFNKKKKTYPKNATPDEYRKILPILKRNFNNEYPILKRCEGRVFSLSEFKKEYEFDDGKCSDVMKFTLAGNIKSIRSGDDIEEEQFHSEFRKFINICNEELNKMNLFIDGEVNKDRDAYIEAYSRSEIKTESVEESNITDSMKKERIKLLEKIENKIKESGGTINISSQSRKCFLGEQKTGGSPVSGPHSICLAGFGKDNYNKAFNIIKEVLKDYPSYRISKDNYYTMFLSYKTQNINESKELENYNLNNFTKMKIDNLILKKYQKELKHIRETNKGYVFINNDELVAVIAVENKDDGVWITALEIFNGYKKHGLSYKLLDIATKEFKATKLSVNKKNTIAISLYKKYGFVIYDETDHMYFMKIKNNTEKETKESVEKSDYEENNLILSESSQKSTVDVNFDKKTGGHFEFIDIHSSKADKYLKDNKYFIKNFKKIIDITNGEIVIDVDKDKLAGYIYIGGGDKNKNKNHGFIQTLEVIKEYRGYGLSNRLIDDAIKKYNAEDLTVFTDNEVAINLYKKHGFVIIGYGNTKNGSDYWMKHKSKLTKDDQIMESEDYDFEDLEFYFNESEESTFIIRDAIFPIVEAVLSSPQGDKKFRKLVENFINKNSSKLHTSGPVYMVPFTDRDKEDFFDCFNTNKNELLKPINEMTKIVNDKANWKLLKQNPIFCLFYQCIRYYTLTKNNTGVNTALAIYALSVYPSVFSHIFKYGANPDIMQYTIDNLTAKYIIKQAGNIFSALMMSIQNSYRFLREGVIDSSDAEVIRFIARIRNDQKSMLKNVANNYYPNHEKGLRVKTQSETYGNEQLIDDNINNTSVVEDVTRKIVISLITNGVDMTRASAAAKIAGVSISDLRFYLSKIVVEDRTMELQKFIESILFIFLYQEHHKPNEINEKKFLQFSMDLFRRTNSNDVNVVTIKESLQKWSDDTGVTVRFKRLASQINYKKGIFMYMILCIQYYNN